MEHAPLRLNSIFKCLLSWSGHTRDYIYLKHNHPGVLWCLKNIHNFAKMLNLLVITPSKVFSQWQYSLFYTENGICCKPLNLMSKTKMYLNPWQFAAIRFSIFEVDESHINFLGHFFQLLAPLRISLPFRRYHRFRPTLLAAEDVSVFCHQHFIFQF